MKSDFIDNLNEFLIAGDDAIKSLSLQLAKVREVDPLIAKDMSNLIAAYKGKSEIAEVIINDIIDRNKTKLKNA